MTSLAPRGSAFKFAHIAFQSDGTIGRGQFMDRLEAIEKLARLRDCGVLTDSEYANQKQIVMSSTSLTTPPAPVQGGSNHLYGSPIRQPAPAEQALLPTQHIHINNANTQTVSAPMPYYNPYDRSILVAYLLWFFLGVLGAHRFYLGRVGTGVAQLLLCVLGWIPLLLGWGVLGIWLLIDIFLIPQMARSRI